MSLATLMTSFGINDIPDKLKTREMCEQAVSEQPGCLKYVPDWFITAEMLEKCQDKEEEWFEGFKRRKAQRLKIKEELLPVTWHPDRVFDWCFSEDEKKT